MQLLIIVALVSSLVSGGGAWLFQSYRCDAKELVRVNAEAELKRNREKTVTEASTSYEGKKATQRVKYVKTIEVVEKIVDRPVYKNVCLDEDGLKAINEGIQP